MPCISNPMGCMGYNPYFGLFGLQSMQAIGLEIQGNTYKMECVFSHTKTYFEEKNYIFPHFTELW